MAKQGQRGTSAHEVRLTPLETREKPLFSSRVDIGNRVDPGAIVIITAQLPSRKSELRFWGGSNPSKDVSKICDGEDLWLWSLLEIRL